MTVVAILATDPKTYCGSISAAVISAIWLACCAPPRRVILSSLSLSVAIFLPYFLLVPWSSDVPLTTRDAWSAATSVAWSIVFRGVCATLVGIATATILNPRDLREAIIRLPAPRVVRILLIQIVQQLGTLTHETRGIAAALAVRGATSGSSLGWRVLCSLPRVWLPRVITRAERVAAVMELRGYDSQPLVSFVEQRSTSVDRFAMAGATAVLGFAIVLRTLNAP